jgi:hypothetical protein
MKMPIEIRKALLLLMATCRIPDDSSGRFDKQTGRDSYEIHLSIKISIACRRLVWIFQSFSRWLCRPTHDLAGRADCGIVAFGAVWQGVFHWPSCYHSRFLETQVHHHE